MTTDNFIEAWNELFPIQQEAAEFNDGAFLLLAGPGSGKTRVLTCRIARLLNESERQKFRILCLTFTNQAADEMRSRIMSYVPGEDNRLFIGTFHSFCADVLRQHGLHIGINSNFQIYSHDTDLQAISNEAERKAKKNYNIEDLHIKILPVIQRLKARLITPSECFDIFKDKNRAEIISIIYEEYEKELSVRNALDFNSLILKTYLLFKKYPAIVKRYMMVYKYICIDEFQDTNLAQYNLLRIMTGYEGSNLFVVADDDQIIYQWNGASNKRLTAFIEDYSPTIIQLPINYRCPPEIVSIANLLISHNYLRTANKKPLESFRNSTGKGTLRLFHFKDYAEESASIAIDIKKNHFKELDSVVVLGRNRKLLEEIEKSLHNENISATISQRKDDFESNQLIWVYNLLCLSNNRQERKYLDAVCGAFLRLFNIFIDSEEVIDQAEVSNNDYLNNYLKLVLKHHLESSIFELINYTKINLAEGRDFRHYVDYALSWFDNRVEKDSQYEDERQVWKQLTSDIDLSLGDNVSLESFLQEMQMRSKDALPTNNSVILMTIHGAKGKEFDYVYLVGLMDDELPSFQSKKKGPSSDEMEEERRNCFVALTRAKKTLTLSYSLKYRGWSKQPSRFLYEMELLSS